MNDPVCKYGFHSNHCELGYPGCACADDMMAEIERMGGVPHAYEDDEVPGYHLCRKCMGTKGDPIHTRGTAMTTDRSAGNDDRH